MCNLRGSIDTFDSSRFHWIGFWVLTFEMQQWIENDFTAWESSLEQIKTWGQSCEIEPFYVCISIFSINEINFRFWFKYLYYWMQWSSGPIQHKVHVSSLSLSSWLRPKIKQQWRKHNRPNWMNWRKFSLANCWRNTMMIWWILVLIALGDFLISTLFHLPT